MGIGFSSESKLERGLADFVDNVQKSVESIKDTVKILCLGIDYKRYTKFRLLTPNVFHFRNNEYHIQKRLLDSKKPLILEDVEFCINFVIESAINLQEFDFNVI